MLISDESISEDRNSCDFKNVTKFGSQNGPTSAFVVQLTENNYTSANQPKRYGNVSSFKCSILQMNKFCGYFRLKLLVWTEILMIFRNFNKFGL